VRYYAWDGWRNVVEAEHVYDGTSPSTWQAAPVKQFVWGAELDELVSYRRKVPTATVPAWETYYLLHGGQETAAKLVDANGEVVEQYEYDPYGRATVFSKVAGQWTSGGVSRYGLPFLWKAVRLDEVTGLLQMRNRYYSVETGRFLTRDPIGVWGDLGNLGNEYGYAWQRQLVVGDTYGLQSGIHVVMTNFGPFPGFPNNASQDFTATMGDAMKSKGLTSSTTTLPVQWDEAAKGLSAAVSDAAKKNPEKIIVVIAVGRGNNKCPEIEYVAKNKRGPHEDSSNRAPESGTGALNNGADSAASRRYAPDGLTNFLKGDGLQVDIDAGQYVCEEVAYHLYGVRGGVFIHVPDDKDKSTDVAKNIANKLAALDVAVWMMGGS
jgi:RHS repeat-associated protein